MSGKLKLTTNGDREIVMVREFDAPRALVYEAMTRPEFLRKWFHGPGWELAVCEIDMKVGGKYRYVWRLGGQEMGMSGVLTEVDPPKRWAATEKFDQAWYPGEARSSIELTEKDGKTTLTQTVTYSSKEARDVVLKSPMESGASAGYDRLEAFLASRKS
jgi:uncharacterized protein YndB with AHSA1/START domain